VLKEPSAGLEQVHGVMGELTDEVTTNSEALRRTVHAFTARSTGAFPAVLAELARRDPWWERSA